MSALALPSYSSGTSPVPLLGDTIGADLDRTAARVGEPRGAGRVRLRSPLDLPPAGRRRRRLRPDDLERRTATVGRVHPHLEVKVVDPATGLTVPRGTPGEFCTRGYSVMLGYWDQPEKTAEVIDAARWMHTGDLAPRGRSRSSSTPTPTSSTPR